MIPAITEVNFPSYATLHQATVSLQDMGDRVITTQVRIDGDVVPDFSGWELRFKGERFVLPSDNPQASKDNTTRNSIIDLQFQSWVIQELKRYYFFEAASVSAGVAIADKYIAPVRLNIEDFVALLNQVLQYYFGGKVVADLYLSGTGIYSQEPKVVDINYSYLWDVIGKIFEIYGVRNRIEYDATTDVYSIKINYPAPEISDHEFEYGYQGGLLKFERQVQDESLSNVLLGRGGEKNLPYRYFKKVDPQNPEWAADPDAIPELENIHFDRLRDINFRWYVRGWMHNPNRDTSGDEAWDPGHVFPTYEISSDSPHYWAYQKGLTDETFSPVEYVKDDDSIAAYGEHWGALDDNDDVYPTIQGRSGSGIGRIDEVVAVSPIITDDIDAMSEAASIEKSIDSLVVSVYANNRTRFEIESKQFTIPAGSVGDITYTPLSNETVFPNFVKYDTENTRLVAVPISGGAEIPATGIPAGTYRLKLYLALSVESPAPAATGDFGIENIVLKMTAQDENAWKPTFDIWVKDVWGTTRQQGETDAQYSERVWGPILGDRAGNEAKVAFSTGFMASSEDYEFVVASYPVPDTSKSINGIPSAWRITLRKSDAEFDATGLYIPNATAGGQPVAGDKFFFVGIDMPHLYVEMAEEELSTVKSGELQGTATVNPTWIISLDKVRVNTLEAGEYGQTLADRLAAGAKLRVYDPRFSGGDVLTLHAQSVTYTWNEPTDESPYIVPDIEVVLSDKVVSRESRQDKIESSVEQIKAQYARLDDVESVVRMVAEPLFLKKTGESDSSASPTQFSSKVSSKGFRQGGVGGSGWGFYKDNTDELAEGEIGDGDAVLEVDRMVVRKDLQVNSLVVNQVEYRGGMEVISAAKIEISKVIETDTRYVCYFDQRKNSVANNFLVGDIAYGQVFTPQNATLRYYKCKVEAVDIDRVELSKTVKDGAGVPHAGDILVQYGSYTNAARQYVIVRDVVGGGYERMISGLNAVDAAGAEYYFAGRQSGSGPRWFVGGHGANDDYAEFANGVLTIKANVVFKPGQQIPGLEDYEYLKTALPLDEDATLVQGGLILSKTIALTDAQGNVKAGINGLTTLGDIAAWYGGPMVDHEARPSASAFAKSLFRFDGSGYLAGGNIHWGADGYGGIPGVTWSSEGGQDVITIGGNVRLASVDGDTVTELLTAIQNLPNVYVDFVSAQTVTGVKTFTNGIKIGNATLTWVPASGNTPGYLHIDSALVTAGDQIVISGTPGGGGGSSYLRLLEDVYHNESGVRRYTSGNVGSTDLLAYDSTKGWYAVQLGSGLSLSNGVLTASGGGGGTSYTSGTVEELNAGSGTVDRVWTPSVLASWLSGKDYVTRTTAQTITAAHTFSNGLKLNTASSSWTNSDRALYFGASGDDANLRYYNVDADKGLTYNPNTGALKSGSFVKRGGTSAQFLKADGSVDSNTYLTTASAADTYVLKTGDTMTGDLTIRKSGGGALNIQGSAHNAASGEIVFNPHGTQIRNGAKISAVAGSTSYDLIDIVFSASNNRTSPYSPDWYETLRIKYDKSVILANAGVLKWMNNPSEGDPTAIDCIKLTSGNIFIIGRGVANNSYDSYLEGKSVYIRTGTSTLTSRLSVSQSAITMSLDTIPNVDDTYKLGNANRYWKELYTKKVYLAAGIYIEYVDNSGNGYVHINAPLVTDGDQIVLSGTPGGGGGGASFLADLNDVTLTNLADTNLLQWNGTAWVNVAASSVGVTTEGTEVNLNAGTPSTDKMVWAPATLASWLANKGYSTTANTVSNVAVGDSGHTTELAITKAGSTSYITVPFATMTERPKYVTPTQSADAIDLNTILAGGGITRNVWSQGYWNHAPSGIGYFGAAWQINAHSSETGAMQFAWNGNYTGTTPTKSLWFRVRNSEQWGDDWHLIYDSANLTKSVITGLLDAGNGTYLPLSGGTMTGSINMTDGKQIMDSTGTWAMLGLSSTGVFYCGPGYQVSSAFLIRSGDMDLKHRRYTANTASGYNEYTIFDEANANLLSVSWSALNLTAAGTLTASGLATLNGGINTTTETATGTITALNFALSATNASSKIVFAREGYNYLQIPANGQLNVVANSSLSAANSTAIFTATDIRPGSNGGYNLGYVDSSSADNNRLWNVYAQEMMLVKANGPTLTLRGTGDNTDGATILFKSSSANHNGFKIAVEKAASSNNRGRLALNFYSSNVTTDPYEPDWKRALRVSYNGNVFVGASDFSNTLYAYGTAVIGSATAISGATLSVTGVIASTGDQVVTSDARMKTNLKPVELTVEQIAKCRAVTFDWTTGGHSFGSIAQDWQDILPEAVHKGNTLSLAYAQLGTVIGITLAKHETEQDKEIRELKERVKYLEEEVKRLRS